ncbi:uncharacterized protein WM277_000353 [Molossus nigricans]
MQIWERSAESAGLSRRCAVGPEGGWAGAAGSAESAEIKNLRHSRRIERPRLGSAKPGGGRWQGAQLCAPGQGRAQRGGSVVRAVRVILPSPAPRRPPSPSCAPAAASTSRLWPKAPRPPPGAHVRRPGERALGRTNWLLGDHLCWARRCRGALIHLKGKAPEPADPKWSLNRWPENTSTGTHKSPPRTVSSAKRTRAQPPRPAPHAGGRRSLESQRLGDRKVALGGERHRKTQDDRGHHHSCVNALERLSHLQKCLHPRRAQASSHSPIVGPHAREEQESRRRSWSPTSVHLGARSAPPGLLAELWLQRAPVTRFPDKGHQHKVAPQPRSLRRGGGVRRQRRPGRLRAFAVGGGLGPRGPGSRAQAARSLGPGSRAQAARSPEPCVRPPSAAACPEERARAPPLSRGSAGLGGGLMGRTASVGGEGPRLGFEGGGRPAQAPAPAPARQQSGHGVWLPENDAEGPHQARTLAESAPR